MSNYFKKNLDFIKEISIIQIKSIKEYKTNLYLGLIANITFSTLIFITFSILKNNFGAIFYWSYKEFILFFLFLEIFLFIFAIWFNQLPKVLLRGEFNNYLLRPINPFINYAFSNVRYFNLLIAILYIILLMLYLIFIIPKFYFLKFLITFLFAIFGGIFYSSIHCFIDSMSFYLKKTDNIKSNYHVLNEFYSRYPISFFKQSKLNYLGLIAAGSYYASFTTDFYFGYINITQLFYYFLILILLIITLSISSYFLWKNGIKNYEAYG